MAKAPLAPTPAAPTSPPTEHQVLSEAAHWFALLTDEAAPANAQAQWQAWLDANECHRQAWQKVQAIGAHFRMPGPLPGQERQHLGHILEKVEQQRITRRRCLRALSLFGIAGLGAWVGVSQSTWSLNRLASHRTHTGQRQSFTLTDGTQLWLNSASAAHVAYGAHERVIDLLEGELWLQSGQDSASPARDLLVNTPMARLRALGTQFSVWLDQGSVDLSVYEGAVRIEPHAALAASMPEQIVSAGERLRFTSTAVQAKQTVSAARQSWRNGMLLAENIRLEAFLQELSRYRRGRIDCAAEVANLYLIGIYQLDDTDAVLNSLALALPVRITRITPWWVRVAAR